MSRNIKLTLRYDGSGFHGWQFQPNCISVEQELKQACKRILGEDVKLHSCSRTDTGVHANMFCCNFHTDCLRDNYKIILGLNAVLPESIAVYGCDDVPVDFHSRYDCKGKEYIYKIWNGKQRNPFYNNYALHFPRYLDENFLNSQASQFIGTHDFSAFCASGCTVKDHVRTVYDCSVERNGELITFSVRGDGFLYNMVRIMVGTILDISDGKIEPNMISEIIDSQKREKAGITAKPQGLYLNKVFY
ncbi:MAG: tRNA pseudouridine(38-40) synthase TruA [Faecalibacterium sp.]|nr:tRNA pseudouridine(38-40) synthase TruA [Ruminococcus sp.]MCM1392640.1 tRNA pseudouridine(38-40) synthase TruA [Ruminococcus sp.]MCM1486355.1 tRNA pseudouridine(38-40) synthase TruA [Faecalibacterium sp.]